MASFDTWWSDLNEIEIIMMPRSVAALPVGATRLAAVTVLATFRLASSSDLLHLPLL
jgi:hypothetical protein